MKSRHYVIRRFLNKISKMDKVMRDEISSQTNSTHIEDTPCIDICPLPEYVENEPDVVPDNFLSSQSFDQTLNTSDAATETTAMCTYSVFTQTEDDVKTMVDVSCLKPIVCHHDFETESLPVVCGSASQTDEFAINEKLLKISSVNANTNQVLDHKNQIEAYKSNIMSFQILLASKECEYEAKVQHLQHEKDEIIARNKKTFDDYKEDMKVKIKLQEQKCLDTTSREVNTMNLYSRAEVQVRVYENNYSTKRYAENLLHMADYYILENKLEDVLTSPDTATLYKGLRERIQHLEEGVKLLTQMCSLKEMQLQHNTEQIDKLETTLQKYESKLSEVVQKENLLEEQNQTLEQLNEMTVEKNTFKEKCQRLIQKNQSLTELLHETTGDFLKREQGLNDGILKLKQHIKSLYKGENEPSIEPSVKDFIQSVLAVEADSNTSLKTIEYFFNEAALDINEYPDNEDVVNSSSDITVSSFDLNTSEAENYSYANLNRKYSGEMIDYLNNSPVFGKPKGVSLLPYQGEEMYDECDVNNLNFGSSYSNNEHLLHSNSSNSSVSSSHNEPPFTSPQMKYTKKTVSWSDQVNRRNSMNCPNRKVKGKNHRSDCNSYRQKQPQQETEHDSKPDGYSGKSKHRNKSNNKSGRRRRNQEN